MPDTNLDLTALPLGELYALREKAEAEFDAIAIKAQADSKPASDTINAINAEFSRRLMPVVANAYKDAGKQSGALTIDIGDGLVVRSDIGKTVSWDSDKLMKIAGELPWAKVNAIFDIKFSVKEAKFKAVRDFEPVLANAIEAARTTKYAPAPKLVVEPKKERAA